jgi:ABC-2 type transport system permease protein
MPRPGNRLVIDLLARDQHAGRRPGGRTRRLASACTTASCGTPLAIGFLRAPGAADDLRGTVLRAAAGSVLYLALIALLSLGVAAAVRETAAAIGIVLGLLYLFPILTQVAGSAGWHRHLQQIAPMLAGLEIQASTGLRTLPISPWPGFGVLAAWATAALLAGTLLLRLRDA